MYYVAWRLFVFRLLAEILKLDLKHVNSVTNYKKYFHYLVDVIEKPVLQLRRFIFEHLPSSLTKSKTDKPH